MSTPFEDPPIADLDDPELLAAVRKRLETAKQSLQAPEASENIDDVRP